MKPLGNGINGNIFRIIYNMYQKIKSCVFPSGQQSDFFHSHCGVRQGENLSSVLFSLFFNDLNDYLQSSNCSGVNLSEAFNTAVCRRHGGIWNRSRIISREYQYILRIFKAVESQC